jgi:molybdopterin-guanine dinucleotide biosynthesis protein A
MAPSPVVAIVLAGGAARRMGGGDKGLIELGGRPMLARIKERVGAQVDRVLLNADGDPARFAALRLETVADPLPGRPGPLAGILAGLLWAERWAPHALVLSVPTDVPFLPHDLVAGLRTAMRASGAPAAIAVSSGRRHPTIGLWTVGLAPTLRAAIVDQGLRRAEAWAQQIGAAIATWPTEPVDPFVNINTPADLERAEALLAAYPGAVDSPGASR